MTKKKHSDEEFVTRAYTAAFEVLEEEAGVIIGTPIVFNQRTRIVDYFGDEFNEIVSPTALEKTDMRDVRLFVNHDLGKIALARSKNGNANSTMSFNIDGEGVHMRAKLDIENNAEARALYSAIQRGDVDGMSFGFRVRGEEWTDVNSKVPTRTITDISILHEVSVVNFPAYPQTSVSTRSGSPYSALKEMRAHAEETAEIERERLKNMNILNLM
jgi:HK97 family phage prohead protease